MVNDARILAGNITRVFTRTVLCSKNTTLFFFQHLLNDRNNHEQKVSTFGNLGVYSRFVRSLPEAHGNGSGKKAWHTVAISNLMFASNTRS